MGKACKPAVNAAWAITLDRLKVIKQAKRYRKWRSAYNEGE